MRSKLKFFALQSQKRARTQARRLAALVRKYQRDPSRNYGTRSEAAALAMKISYYIRQAEMAGRVILTEDGQRRQFFLLDGVTSAHASTRNFEHIGGLI